MSDAIPILSDPSKIYVNVYGKLLNEVMEICMVSGKARSHIMREKVAYVYKSGYMITKTFSSVEDIVACMKVVMLN